MLTAVFCLYPVEQEQMTVERNHQWVMAGWGCSLPLKHIYVKLVNRQQLCRNIKELVSSTHSCHIHKLCLWIASLIVVTYATTAKLLQMKQTVTCCFKSVFVFHVRQRREFESGLKIGLHPLVRPHSGQAGQEILGRYSALWLEEREEHQSPECAAALCSDLLASQICINTKKQYKTKNSTYLQWWKWWQWECEKRERRSDGESSKSMTCCFAHMLLQQQESWLLFTTSSSISPAAGRPSFLPL